MNQIEKNLISRVIDNNIKSDQLNKFHSSKNLHQT
jgi:hypothetical protein